MKIIKSSQIEKIAGVFQRFIGWIWTNRIMVVPVIALGQCLSIWNCQGEKVDESELVHFAVGFLGGDLDPHWYGYGSFGMYFLGTIFFGIGQILIFLGAYESTVEYGSALYDSGLFLIVSRYVFALLGIIAVLVYAKIVRRLGAPQFVILLFILLAIFSQDGLYYANYVRSDQLLSLIFAILLYVCIFDAGKIRGQAVLALLMSAAVTTKINAIFCLPIIFIPILINSETLGKWFKRSVAIFCIFIVGTLIFQPFHTIFHSIYDTYALRLAGDATFSYSKTIYVGFYEHLSAIAKVYYNTLSPIILVGLIFIPLALRKYFSLVAYIICFCVLYTSVYFLSWEVTPYWFLPTFMPIRLLGCLSLFCFFDFIIPSERVKYIGIAFCVFSIVVIFLLAAPRYTSFSRSIFAANDNKWAAKSWICRNGMDSVLLDAHYDHVMPHVFQSSDPHKSKMLSNAFIYGRSDNKFLNEAFEVFLEREQDNCPALKSVEEVRAFNVDANSSEWDQRVNKYMVVSPSVYNRFLKNPGKRFSPEKLKNLQMFQDYYTKILSQTLVRRFDEGTGAVIEVYHLK